MRKVFDRLKKYLVITFVLSIIIFIWAIVSSIRNNTLPTVNLIYIIKAICCILGLTILLVPAIAMIDLLVKGHMSLVKDFKESDSKGKITIVVVCIMILLRKILIWTS
ncbi:5'-3' nuclease [Clostridium cagae]|nr:5'-3' nuclease [Clostridium sp. ZBS14]